MLLKYFYDNELAHASYFVGCQRTGEALIIDPSRHIQPYLALAKKENMRIVASADTHIHADYVSGGRELAETADATLYVSGEGGPDWQIEYAKDYPHRILMDGDRFSVGNLDLDVMHTPGHTPESLSYLLTDRGGGASEPMGIFTGDFVFVGSLGRPDLLEKAVGEAGAAQEGARAMYASVQKFQALADYLQVWPAHGAGSACGKGLGAVPSSTVGYEKRFNVMLGYEDEAQFCAALLDGQPEPPKYYAVMKHVNRVGPRILGDGIRPKQLSAETLPTIIESGATVVDTRNRHQFAAGHVAGSINIEAGNIASWAGWLVEYGRPVYIIAGNDEIGRITRVLCEIGHDDIGGYFLPDDVAAAGHNTQTYAEATVATLAEQIESGAVTLIDVRAQSEWDSGHLPQAKHIMLGYLPEHAASLPSDKPIVVQCRSGARSAIGASVLSAAGVKNVTNLLGGYLAWAQAGLPIIKNGAS